MTVTRNNGHVVPGVRHDENGGGQQQLYAQHYDAIQQTEKTRTHCTSQQTN